MRCAELELPGKESCEIGMFQRKEKGYKASRKGALQDLGSGKN